jgi:alpha-tubulin suppressor-like RCC1 family protein
MILICMIIAWGSSGARLGHGSTSAVEKVPRLISRLSNDTIIEVACGHTFTLLLSITGHVYGMGDGGTEGVLPKATRHPTKLQVYTIAPPLPLILLFI